MCLYYRYEKVIYGHTVCHTAVDLVYASLVQLDKFYFTLSIHELHSRHILMPVHIVVSLLACLENKHLHSYNYYRPGDSRNARQVLLPSVGELCLRRLRY